MIKSTSFSHLFLLFLLPASTFGQELNAYSIKVGVEISVKDYYNMANESLSQNEVSVISSQIKLFSLAPLVVFPLYKMNKAKKFRPSLMVGFSFAKPKNVDLKNSNGETYRARVTSNQLFFRTQLDYYFSFIGLRALGGYHLDLLKIESDKLNQSNFAYGGAILLGYPFKKDKPKVFGSVLSVYKMSGFNYYWMFSIEVPIGLMK